MESSLREIFDRMESRLGEILDRMEARLLEIIAAAEDKRPAESISFTTESAADEHFNEFDDLDKGPVFDADHVVVSVFEFVRPEYDVELIVFDTDSDSLDDLPVFDTEPVHNAAPASDYAAFTALKFAIRNPATDDPDELTTEDHFFTTEYATNGGPLFDEEDKDPILDDGPLFDEEPGHGEEELSTDTELVLGSIIAVAATTVVDVMYNVTMPVQVYTIAKEVILELDLGAVAPTVIADVPNNVNTIASSTCSTKCPSPIVDFILVSGWSTYWIDFLVVLERGGNASVVNSWFSVEWVEPWSPHMQLNNEQAGGVTRPDPWPSLCLYEVEEHPRYRSMCPASNSELIFMLSRIYAPSNATALQKCSGASKLAWHKGSFMVFWCWQLIQMEFWCSLHFQLNIRWSRDEEWQTNSLAADFGWMPLAEPVMNHYTEATDGSYVETKETALVWHHQDADKVFGSAQAKELHDHLNNVLTNEQFSVKSGQFIVKVKPQGVSKSLVAEKILTLMKDKGGMQILCYVLVMTGRMKICSKILLPS